MSSLLMLHPLQAKDTLCGKCYKTYSRPHCASCNEAIMEAECTIANGQKYHVRHPCVT